MQYTHLLTMLARLQLHAYIVQPTSFADTNSSHLLDTVPLQRMQVLRRSPPFRRLLTLSHNKLSRLSHPSIDQLLYPSSLREEWQDVSRECPCVYAVPSTDLAPCTAVLSLATISLQLFYHSQHMLHTPFSVCLIRRLILASASLVL